MTTYRRVIPRDLFNEASLLKCYARLWILLDEKSGHRAELVDCFDEPDDGFKVEQSQSSGAIWIDNVRLLVGGYTVELYRPLNSRRDWPLYAGDVDNETEVSVFDDDGNLTPEFWAMIEIEQ